MAFVGKSVLWIGSHLLAPVSELVGADTQVARDLGLGFIAALNEPDGFDLKLAVVFPSWVWHCVDLLGNKILSSLPVHQIGGRLYAGDIADWAFEMFMNLMMSSQRYENHIPNCCSSILLDFDLCSEYQSEYKDEA